MINGREWFGSKPHTRCTIWRQTNIHRRGDAPNDIIREIRLDLEELHTAYIYGIQAVQTP